MTVYRKESFSSKTQAPRSYRA